MDYGSNDCIDAGTENCPCYLALTGDCLTCSRLQGRDNCDCDCNWRGVCIYNEFILGGKRVNNPRQEFEAPIISRTFYMDDFLVLVLGVEEGFAQKLMKPGSYIFLRNKTDPVFFATPISVMKVEASSGKIHVAVKLLSAKTKALAEAGESLMIKGVYRNGIQGVRHLINRNVRGKKILFITKGIGIAPAPMTVQLLKDENQIDFVIDKEKICDEFITDYVDVGNGIIRYISLIRKEDIDYLKDILNHGKYDIVVILTSDYYLDMLFPIVREVLPQSVLAWGNNSKICCGEGICGSCTIADEQGETIRHCKCQLSHHKFNP
ncbi:MAG: hypothetical protein ACOX4U_02485 [Anaerovoracaceae bacterium]|jgi:NAD(P)H-flavin reductase